MDALIPLAEAGPVGLYLRGLVLLAAVAALSTAVRGPAARHALWLGALVTLLALPALPALVVEAPTSLLDVTAETAAPPQTRVGGAGVLPSTSPVPTPRAPTDPRSLLALLWLGGVLALLARGVAQRVRLDALARHAELAGPPWGADVHHASVALGLRQHVEVRVSPDVSGPLVWGVLRPVLLLPPASADWSGAVRRSVLLHELAHIRRLDLAAGLVADLACAVHWANPLVWLAAHRLHQARERACDLAAVRAGVARTDYSDHLLTVARASRPSSRLSPALAFTGGGPLRARVLHVLSAPDRRAGWLPAALCLALAVPLAALRLAPPDVQASAPQTVHTLPAPTSTVPRPTPFGTDAPALSTPPAADEQGRGEATPRPLGAEADAAPPDDHAASPPTVLPPPTSPPAAASDPTALDLPAEIADGDPWSFALDAPGSVQVALYALDGRLVATLASGRYDAGRHPETFASPGPGAYVVGARLGSTTVRQRLRVWPSTASR